MEERVRLVKKEEPQRIDDLAAIIEAARAVSERTDVNEALEVVLTTAMNLVGADEGSVQLVDKATMTLSVVVSFGLSAQGRAQRTAVGQGISGTVAVTGDPLLLQAAVDVDRFMGYIPKDRPITAALCVPLRARDGIIGVLNVNTTRPGATFTQRDLHVVSVLAETTALGIANGRLLESARRHALELETLRGATLRLGTSLDLATVAQSTVQEALGLAGSDAGFVALMGEGGGPLEIARYSGLSHEALASVLSSPSFRRLNASQDVRVIADVAADPALAALARDVGKRGLALVPLRTADGHAAGLLGVALPQTADTDTRRLLATFATQAGLAISNALLHRSVSVHEEQMASIVMTLDLPLMLIDDDGRFQAINPAAASLFNLSPEFELGQPVRGKLDEQIEALVLDTGDPVATEVVVGEGATERIFMLRIVTVSPGRGVGGRMLVLADISNERELERKKGDFVAVIGHELRTPLTNVRGYARTLATHFDRLDPATAKRSIDTIVVQSERLQRLIEDLLFVSRVEATRPQLHLVDEDVVSVCQDIVAEASRRAPLRPINFTPPADAIAAFTDRLKVEQILMHLLDNAVKYSEEDQAIAVAIQPTDHLVTIEVTDRGRGIFSGDLKRIFDPFVQVDSTSTRDVGGMGIGLYIARTMAATLGGHIDVRSAIGKGSTFTLTIPRRSIDPSSQPS